MANTHETKPGPKNPEKATPVSESREQAEKIQKERERVKKAVENSKRLVSEMLQGTNLSAQDKARLELVLQNAEQVEARLKEGAEETYLDKILGPDGKILAQRAERASVDELINLAADLKARTQRRIDLVQEAIADKKESGKIEDKFKLSAVRATMNGEEKKINLVWHQVFEGLPQDNQFRQHALDEVATMEASARAQAQEQGGDFPGFSPVEKSQKLGEALQKIVEVYTKLDSNKIKSELERRQKHLGKYTELMQALQKNSLPYFACHFPENFKDGRQIKPLSPEQQQAQSPFTKREARTIGEYPVYRQNLITRFSREKQLPDNFDNLNAAEQHLALANLVFENRRVLVLPKEQMTADGSSEKNETGNTQTTKATLGLENTNQPFDLENKALSAPEAKKVEQKQLFLIDISEIAKRMAWTKAEEKLRQQFDIKGGFLKRWAKNTWKGLSENHYRVKYYQEALKEIENDNNLMRAISERVSGGESVSGSKTRVSGEYLELLDKIVAEYKNDVADANREVGANMKDNPEVRNQFAELLYRYRTNKWEGDEYQGLDKRSAVELFVKQNIAGQLKGSTDAYWTKDFDRAKEAKGLLYASNFYEILESVDQNYKGQIDAAVKEVMDKNPEANMEAVRAAIASHVEGVQGLNLQLGLKDRDLVNNRPKGILKWYEKMVDWGENHKVLGQIVMNPLVVGAAATASTKAFQTGLRWAAVTGVGIVTTATGFWVPLGVGAAAGGLYAAFKRSKDIKYDLAQEERHETLGGKGSAILEGRKGKQNLRFSGAAMSYKEAMSQIAAMAGKKTFSEEEKQQLVKIYARLQRESDSLKDTPKLAKLDLFNLDEDTGNRYGSTAGAKSDLKIALKNLGISEQELQGRIDVEKAAIRQIVKNTNEQRGLFWASEVTKSFFGGAVMGFVGGVLAQEATHLVGEQLEKLWGGQYFHNQHTSFDRIVDWAKDSHLYQSHFVQGVGVAAGVEHIVTSRAQTSGEWLNQIKGHIAGGDVQKIHTTGFYDNPTGGGPHIHNGNELQFHISKDSAGNFHFKVPIEENGSWNEKGWADITKAFSEGKIKMLFVPDGQNVNNAIVLDVDAVTHEVIIPKGSNLENLFDVATGHPKGDGFFGLAEQTGIRQDGSQNYVWINSKAAGGQIDFGKVSQTVDFTPDKVTSSPTIYDQAMAAVLPGRKVYARPGEDPKADKKKQQQAEKEAKKKVRETAAGEKGGGGSSTNSGGGGGGESQKSGDKSKTENTPATGSGEKSKTEKTTETGSKPTESNQAGEQAGAESDDDKKKEAEPEVDPESKKIIAEFNKKSLNKQPHYRLDFDKTLLSDARASESREFIKRLIALLDDPNAGLRDSNFGDKNVILRFAPNGPYEPSVDKYGTFVLNLDPDLELNALGPIIRRQLKKKEGTGQPNQNEKPQGNANQGGEQKPK